MLPSSDIQESGLLFKFPLTYFSKLCFVLWRENLLVTITLVSLHQVNTSPNEYILCHHLQEHYIQFHPAYTLQSKL